MVLQTPEIFAVRGAAHLRRTSVMAVLPTATEDGKMEGRKDRSEVLVPFSPGESLRVYRLQGKGLALDLERGLTESNMPLRQAWLAFLTQQAMGRATYVLYDAHYGEAFVQVQYRPHQAAADVAYIAPSLTDHQHANAGSAWSRLLDGVSVEVAARGIQRLFASLPEASPEKEIFQQSGFAVYACEDVFHLAQPPTNPVASAVPGLRPQRTEDWPALQKLCIAITPQRVRQIEGSIALAPVGGKRHLSYVLLGASPDQDPSQRRGSGGDDLVAALYLHIGRQAQWLRLLVHPDAGNIAGALIAWALGRLAGQPPRPVYCNVRQYEAGLRDALQAAGFGLDHTRTLMVKQTTAWAKVPAQELVPALKGSAEPVFHSSNQLSAISRFRRTQTEPSASGCRESADR
jgi:membrane protein YqaA with SNARE-associated domain